MDCRDCQQRVSMLVDGELGEVLTEEVTRHLTACPDCRRVYERISHVSDVMRSFADLAPSSTLAERVKARIAVERERGDEKVFLPVWGRVSLMAMLILLAVGLGNLAGRSMNEMLTVDHSEQILELIAPSQGQSFSDALITLGTEENTR